MKSEDFKARVRNLLLKMSYLYRGSRSKVVPTTWESGSHADASFQIQRTLCQKPGLTICNSRPQALEIISLLQIGEVVKSVYRRGFRCEKPNYQLNGQVHCLLDLGEISA